MTDQTPDELTDPPAYVDIEALLKPRLEEHDFTIKGIGTVRVRTLSRAETLRLMKSTDTKNIDMNAIERRLVTAAMVIPPMTESQVGAWQKACPGGEITELTQFISRISGLEINETAKEAYKEFEDDPEAEFRLPAS